MVYFLVFLIDFQKYLFEYSKKIVFSLKKMEYITFFEEGKRLTDLSIEKRKNKHNQ
jgi:hypothetical protein